jgi:lipopolysaccharide assembly outer membrane protein LptD (OstA)
MKFKIFIIPFFVFSFLIFCEEIKYKADNMKISFDENGDIEKVFLEGNVVILYKDLIIKTEKAIYEKKEFNIEFENGGKILSDIGEIEADYIL